MLKTNEGKFFVVSLLLALILGGAGLAKRGAANHALTNAEIEAVKPLPAGVTAADALRGARSALGPADAPYTIVEFGDYQCPPCAQAYTVLDDLIKHGNGQARFIFRNYPLMNRHPNALNAALVAEAAAEQGKFWPMHDLLYTQPAHLDIAGLNAAAETLKLDLPRFHQSLRYAAKTQVLADLAAAKKLQVDGTPALVLCEPNGTIRAVSIAELQRRFH